jgi:hypothetical protein
MLRCFTFLLIFVLISVPVLAACPAERARYVARGAPQITAGFHILPRRTSFVSDLAFYVHNAATGHTFWFGFDGGSASRVALISTTDVTAKGWRPAENGRPVEAVGPLGEVQYLSAGPDMEFGLDVPRRGTYAPAFIVLPEFAETMWQSDFRGEDAPIGVYAFTACSK